MEPEAKNQVQTKTSNWGLLYFIVGFVFGAVVIFMGTARPEAQPKEITLDMASFDAMSSLQSEIQDMGQRLDRAADAIDYLRKRIGVAPGTVGQALIDGVVDGKTPGDAPTSDEQPQPSAE